MSMNVTENIILLFEAEGGKTLNLYRKQLCAKGDGPFLPIFF